MHTDLQTYADSVPFIDTHSHAAGFDTGTPVDDKGGKSLTQIIMNDYLLYMAGSCTDLKLPGPAKHGGWDLDAAAQQFADIQPLIDQYRGLTTWQVLRDGVRELFPYREDDLCEANFDSINERLKKAYQTYGEREWLRMAARRVNVIRQNQMVTLPYVTDHWDSLPEDDRAAQKNYLLPSLILDGYLFSGFSSGKPGRERTMELLNVQPRTLDEYVAMVGKAMDLFKAKGGASVKLLINYHRTLHFEEVANEVAAPLFARNPANPAPPVLTATEFKQLQDNMTWRFLEMARDKGLPLIVHTGYSWPTDWGDPENMHNLFKSPRLAGLKIDICHSGWPHAGGLMIMSRTYRHCYFNLCWTPMLSYELGRQILSQLIDMTPKNKILFGTDCGSAETFVGTARLMRRVLVDVLSEKVEKGFFSVSVAKSIARAILLENAMEFYNLSAEELGIEAEALAAV